MANDKGSVIVVVLMVLGVVSLLGVTLITQSRLDLQFSQSTRSYDRIFGSADGAASYGLRWISEPNTNDHRREVRDSLFAAGGGGLDPGTHIDVPNLPADLQNTNATVWVDRWEQSPGGSDPHVLYLRVVGEATSPVWAGADEAHGGTPTSTVEISVRYPYTGTP